MRPEQSHRRLARPLAETPEPVRQERQRGVGLFEKSRRGEIGAGQVFLLVVQTGGEPIQFSGAGELTLVPQHVGDEVKRVRLGRTAAQHAFEQAQRFGMLARVGAQFPGVFLPEERIGTFALAKFFEPPDSLAAAGQFAQAGQPGELQVHVVGKLFEQFLDAGEDFGWIGVVGGQGAARRQCQPVVRRRSRGKDRRPKSPRRSVALDRSSPVPTC